MTDGSNNTTATSVEDEESIFIIQVMAYDIDEILRIWSSRSAESVILKCITDQPFTSQN